MTFKRSLDIIDAMNKIAATLAIIVGGVWAYRTYGVERSGVSNIVISVGTKVVRYSTKDNLLVIRVDFKNVGKVLVRPGDLDSNNGGCILTLWRLPNDAPSGALITRDHNPLIRENILDRYTKSKPVNDDKYEFWIEPGAEEHLIEAIPLPISGGVYQIRAQFFFRAGRKQVETISNHEIVRIDLAESNTN